MNFTIEYKIINIYSGHVILQAIASLKPSFYHQYSLLQLVLVHQIDIPIYALSIVLCTFLYHPLRCTKMEPQHRLGIYVGFSSPSIIRYLEPLTAYPFTVRFVDYHFDEIIFQSLGE